MRSVNPKSEQLNSWTRLEHAKLVAIRRAYQGEKEKKEKGSNRDLAPCQATCNVATVGNWQVCFGHADKGSSTTCFGGCARLLDRISRDHWCGLVWYGMEWQRETRCEVSEEGWAALEGKAGLKIVDRSIIFIIISWE